MARLAWLVLLPAALAAQDSTGGRDPGEALRVHFLDVGQGDAVLIEAPTGQRVLIDAGPGAAVVESLTRLGVDTIDLFIASHNHADHIGGAAAVIARFPIRYFMDNGIAHTTVTYRTMLEALLLHDVPILEPERRTFRLGETTLDILPPPGDLALGHNDNSIGVVLRLGDFAATFAGDAEERLWNAWLEADLDRLPVVQLHKASHHGSRNGDIREVIARLSPALVVISAGPGNPYGHPHPEALALYEAAGATVLWTGDHGTVSITGYPEGDFEIRTERGEVPILPSPGS